MEPVSKNDWRAHTRFVVYLDHNLIIIGRQTDGLLGCRVHDQCTSYTVGILCRVWCPTLESVLF